MEENVKSIGDYLSIAWRHKFLILIPFVTISVITVLTVFSLPRSYVSTGTILIESQQIPQELIQSLSTSFADERIQIITQRIMTSKQIFKIINKFNLYQDVIRKTPRSEILEDMRNRILVGRVNASLGGRRKAVIAFTVSFEHQFPVIAQKVANELVTLFLDENIKSRTASAQEATSFFTKEADNLRFQIEDTEEKIADFKQEHKASLPASLSFNIERVESHRTLLFSIKRELKLAKEMKKLHLIDFESLSSGLVVTQSNGIQAPLAELRSMQSKYVSLSARYGADHPDVKSIIKQIKAFENEYGVQGSKSDLEEQINQVRSEIAEMTKRYSVEHPDVKRLKRKLGGLQSMLKEYGNKPDIKNEANKESPEYRRLKVKLDTVDSNIKELEQRSSDLEKQIAQLEIYINQTPQVERGLDTLERDYKSITTKYQEIKSKELEAKLAMSLEENQKGERFTLLETPLLPDKPVKPDRPKLLMLGLMLSIAVGLGIAGLAEILDRGIRGSLALASVTKMRPLVTIPYISNKNDIKVRKRNVKLLVITFIMLGIAFFGLVHFFYKPLDLLWFIFLRKLNLA